MKCQKPSQKKLVKKLISICVLRKSNLDVHAKIYSCKKNLMQKNGRRPPKFQRGAFAVGTKMV